MNHWIWLGGTFGLPFAYLIFCLGIVLYIGKEDEVY